MRCTLAFVLICSSVLASKHVVNYCGSKMCSHTNSHTFCQFNEGPGRDCKGYMEADLTTDEKARIMARLNQRRNAAASGRLPGFPTAGNMLKLSCCSQRWVEELAREAQRWADQCRPPETPERQDDCRDLYSITVGQCVASVVGEAPGLRPESMVDMWYMQNLHYKSNVTSYDESLLHSNYYGDFAQLIWANSFMVGCGRSRFMTPWFSRLRSVERLVCNFAPRGPNVGRPLWTPSAPAATCPPRSVPDSQWTSLCAYQHDMDESHDVDNTMSPEEHILLNTVFSIEKNDTLNYLGSMDELYLTNAAIASMANFRTTPWNINSVRKRDADELFNLLQHKLNTNVVTNETELYPNTTEVVTKAEEVVKPTKLPTQKVSFIGRPKSYNMEDLNNGNGDRKPGNHLDKSSDDIPNHENDLYAEYGFFETPEENTSTTYEEPTVLTIEEATQDIGSEKMKEQNKEVIDTTHMSTETIRTNMFSTNLAVSLMKSYEAFNETIEVVPKAVEDYLSDPETMRILQEELDRMEHAMTSSTNLPGKVRRELRQFPQDIIEQKVLENKFRQERDQHNPFENYQRGQTSEEERNNTEDRTPMMNMMLRYMPYLKGYKPGMEGTSNAVAREPSELAAAVAGEASESESIQSK